MNSVVLDERGENIIDVVSVRPKRRGFELQRDLSTAEDLSDDEYFTVGGDVTVLDSDSREEVVKGMALTRWDPGTISISFMSL